MAPKPNRHQRGYDHRHNRRRQQLLAQLVDGTPCPECGRPLHRDKNKNWDAAPLEADHHDALANYTNKKTAPLAKRLLHRHCNRSGGTWEKPTTPPTQIVKW